MTENVIQDPMFREHLGGASLRAIGQAHGLSHEGVRGHIFRESTRYLNQVELDLLLAQKYEQLQRETEARWPVLVIPNQGQEDRQSALNLLSWTLDKLRERGIETKLIHTPTPAGSAFQIVTAEESSP